MNNILKQNTLTAIVFKVQLINLKPPSSYCSAMEWATGLQLYYFIADPKVGEQHILRKYSKCNIFQVTTDLLNSKNLKVAIAQLWNKLQICNLTML